jgi:hypothetical protein
MDGTRESHLSHDAPETPTEAELLAATDESDRDVAAGLTFPLEDVLAELDRIAGGIDDRRGILRV